MRSGWNGSKSSSFSPVPTKRIGLPTTSFTDSAAPPRASPSILVSTMPSSDTASSNAVATFTASWPVIASTTSSVSWGWSTSRTSRQLDHELDVDLQPARGVDDDHVATEPRRFLERGRRGEDRVLGAVVGHRPHRHVDAPAEHAQLLDRGRALEVGRDEQRLEALALELAGELRGGGRLPRTLEAAHHHDGRRLRAHGELAARPAERGDQLLVDDLDDLLRGREALLHLGAVRPLLQPGDERLDDA